MRRLAVVALGATAVVGLSAPAASAHSGAPDVAAELDGVAPAVPGLRVQIQRSVSEQLVLDQRGPRTVEVLDDDGRPFLRIGRDGVRADLASPAFAASNDPSGVAALPEGVRPGSPPRWRLVSRGSTWAWFDHRLHPGRVVGDDDARARGRTARLAGWRVPLRVGGAGAAIEGAIVFRPQLGTLAPRLEAAPPRGTTATVLPGARPAILVTHTGPERAVVRGERGEPFARFAPGGRGVEVNVRSPLATTLNAGTIAASTTSPDPGARPRWRPAGAGGTLTWLDPRLRPAGPEPGAREARAGRPIVLRRWSIPVTVGGTDARVRGETVWRPTASAAGRLAATGEVERDAGGGTLALVAGGALLVLCAGAGALVLRRRRASATPRS